MPPSEAGVEIPLYLERAILKGLAVQPDDRFQTAGEFLEALENQQVVELPGEQNENLAAAVPAASAAEKKKRPIPHDRRRGGSRFAGFLPREPIWEEEAQELTALETPRAAE